CPIKLTHQKITLYPYTTLFRSGGEDWKFWIEQMKKAGVLAEGAKTVAYSYIGPELTYPIYRNGTIGKAKDDLEGTVPLLNDLLRSEEHTSELQSRENLVCRLLL